MEADHLPVATDEEKCTGVATGAAVTLALDVEAGFTAAETVEFADGRLTLTGTCNEGEIGEEQQQYR